MYYITNQYCYYLRNASILPESCKRTILSIQPAFKFWPLQYQLLDYTGSQIQILRYIIHPRDVYLFSKKKISSDKRVYITKTQHDTRFQLGLPETRTVS